MPNWKKIIVSGSDAILNNVTASGAVISGSLYVSGNILPDSDNVWSLGATDNRFQLNGGTPVTVTGSGVINYVTRFRAATAVETSSIFSSDDETRIVHSNDTNIIFTVSGSNGELFTVTDDNSGNLLEVNDTSGITVFEVDGVGNVTASGEISASGFNISNNITASFFTGSFTGSFLGTASNATTASHVTTASFALRASSASIADTATTASHVVTASFADNATSASYAVSASHEIIKEVSSSFADTASLAQSGDGNFTGSFTGSLSGSGLLSTLKINNTTTDDSLLLTTTEDSSTAAPVITLKRNSSSPADADYLGQLKFKGENDADQEVVYAKITGKIQDASDGSEDGLIEFANKKAGSNNITARLRSDKLQLLNGTSLEVDGNVTAPNFIGTASIADNATTASFADLAGAIRSGLTASFADRATSASIADTLSQLATASFAVTASHALNGGSGGTSVGYSNLQTLSADYTTEDDSYNSLYGPLSVGDGVTLTVSDGSFLKIETF